MIGSKNKMGGCNAPVDKLQPVRRIMHEITFRTLCDFS